MQGLEQANLEKMNESTLDLLFKNCNSEIGKLNTDIAEKKLAIERLETVKSYINKVIYFKQSKQNDNSTVQRKKVTV
jgi:hypothetical protein